MTHKISMTGGSSDKPVHLYDVYDEQLEKEVSNIIGINCEKITPDNKETVWCIKDVSSLTVELMQYIINNYDKKIKRNK